MEKNYLIVTAKIETASGYEFVSKFPDVPGVVGGGSTPEEAVKEAYQNLEFHLECLEKDGCSLPEPTHVPYEDASGKLNVRMSKTLHRRAKLAADLEGVSLNTLINEAVQQRITESIDCECVRKVARYSRYFEEAWEIASENFQLDRINQLKNVGGYYGEDEANNFHKRLICSPATA